MYALCPTVDSSLFWTTDPVPLYDPCVILQVSRKGTRRPVVCILLNRSLVSWNQAYEAQVHRAPGGHACQLAR
jgi:hypothetical protein